MRITLTGLFLSLFTVCLFAADATNLTVTVGGVVYSNVTWGTVTPVSATMFHSSGIAVVPLEKLSPDLQKQFNYDPEKAQTYRAAKEREERPAQPLDRAETGKRLSHAVRDNIWFPWDSQLRGDNVDDIRSRYQELVNLKKDGHRDYQKAIELFSEACKRAIERHYQLKQRKPEYGDAKWKFENFRHTGNALADDRRLNELGRLKTEAEAYHLEVQRLADQARLAWSEGLRAKELADNKGNPPPPKPKPKPAQSDPYLVEDR